MKTRIKRTVSASALVFSGMIALAALAQPRSGMPIWTNRFSSSGDANDEARALAVDDRGNVYVAGYSYGGAGAGNDDYATLAYSSVGVPLWTNRYKSPVNRDSQPSAMVVDNNGNVFVTGYTTALNWWSDYATVGYSSAGVPLWTNCYNGPGDYIDKATAIAVDKSGNVFVTGLSYGANGYSDYATIGYSSAGVPLWTNRYSGMLYYDSMATAVTVDRNGTVFVTGDPDYATIAYSGTGVPLWTNRYKGSAPYGHSATGITVDASGNIFVTGRSGGNGSGYDYATVAYSSAGVPLWTNRYNGPGNGADGAQAVAVDIRGSVFVTGSSLGANISEYVTLAYSGAGVPLWTNRYSGPGDRAAYARATAVDIAGNVSITGYSLGSNTYEFATVAYSGTGIPLWTNRYKEGTGGNYAMAVAVDRAGNNIVTGSSMATIGAGADWVTIKYSSSVWLAFSVPQEENRLVLSWPSATLLLQSAPVITGPFTNIPGATSPYTNSMTSAQQYFRLAAP